MMRNSAWPIYWGFGGIAWRGSDMGLSPSLYVALRFGSIDGSRKPVGFIVRWLPKGTRSHQGLRLGRLYLKRYP